MNAAFWLLILLGAVGVWLYLSCCFKDIGGFFLRLFRGAKEAMQEDDSDEDDDR